MSDTKTAIIKKERRTFTTSLDGLMTRTCLDRTMGDVMRLCETSNDVRGFTVASMIRNAVFELDIELIKTIVTRIDGLVPAEGSRDSYANLLGDALEDVLEYPRREMVQVQETDSPIIAMAKVVIYVATQPAGGNMTRRRERNLAAQMLSERTGGRKVEPTRPELETKYVEPEWMVTDGKGGDDPQGGEAQEAVREMQAGQ